MELQHKVDMTSFGNEDNESLRFDLEIAQSENTMLEDKIVRLNDTITNQETKQQDYSQKMNKLEKSLIEKLS
jgi:predicted  nucleic acid-binding Zn-ribbon protein